MANIPFSFHHLVLLLSIPILTSQLDPKSIENDNSAPPYFAMASIPSPDLERHSLVKGLVEALMGYGGYSEITDLLVNLTSMADEIGRLVLDRTGPRRGLTLLAPNDEAMSALGAEQLEDPNFPEKLMYYHLVAEYLTEESMYVSARRRGKVRYETLLVPLKLTAEEADGTVKIAGGGGSWGHLVDADIYADGLFSVQGIDGVLLPNALDQLENH